MAAGQHMKKNKCNDKKQVSVVVDDLHKNVTIILASHFLLKAPDWQVKRELKRAEKEVDEWQEKGYTVKV